MTRQPMRLNRLGWLPILLVRAAFALRPLSLFEATGLWSDELYTVGKSFQPSVAAMLAMLQLDTTRRCMTGCSGAGGSCCLHRASRCDCLPYPVCFAIEGKGYALPPVVALAWWWC